MPDQQKDNGVAIQKLLTSKYIHHKFQVQLNDSQFNPAGYVETQSDKSTYFVWDKIDEK